MRCARRSKTGLGTSKIAFSEAVLKPKHGNETEFSIVKINYPAASGRGIRRAIIADLHAISDIPFLDFSHNCRSYPHSHASR